MTRGFVQSLDIEEKKTGLITLPLAGFLTWFVHLLKFWGLPNKHVSVIPKAITLPLYQGLMTLLLLFSTENTLGGDSNWPTNFFQSLLR
jgi:hypothetical protein